MENYLKVYGGGQKRRSKIFQKSNFNDQNQQKVINRFYQQYHYVQANLLSPGKSLVENRFSPREDNSFGFQKMLTEKDVLNMAEIFDDQQVKRAKTMGIVTKKTFANGSSYEGKLNDYKQAHGFGIFRFFDGSFYEGYWVQNKAFGKGRFESLDGSSYEGQWKNDKPNGQGVMKLQDGSIYQGNVIEGCKNGYGKYTWSDKKTFYKGEWKFDAIQGRGQLHFSDNRQYFGDFKDNMFHGNGVYIWADGSKYIGQFLYNKKHGKGIYHWNDGRTFQGTWSKGLRQGQGEYVLANGQKRKGIWKLDKRVKWLN